MFKALQCPVCSRLQSFETSITYSMGEIRKHVGLPWHPGEKLVYVVLGVLPNGTPTIPDVYTDADEARIRAQGYKESREVMAADVWERPLKEKN